MVLADHRHRVDPILVPLADRLHEAGVHPDHLTWTSLGVAALAGIVFASATPAVPVLLVVGAILVLLNALLDGLDGKLARRHDQASSRGDYLDHAVDRFADVLILGGLVLGPFVTDVVGLVAIVAMLLTSYLGTQAQAVGLGRNLGGWMGRADRLVLLGAAPVVDAALIWSGVVSPWRIPFRLGPLAVLSVVDLAVLAIAVFGALTVVQRFHAGLSGL